MHLIFCIGCLAGLIRQRWSRGGRVMQRCSTGMFSGARKGRGLPYGADMNHGVARARHGRSHGPWHGSNSVWFDADVSITGFKPYRTRRRWRTEKTNSILIHSSKTVIEYPTFSIALVSFACPRRPFFAEPFFSRFRTSGSTQSPRIRLEPLCHGKD